MKKGIFLDLLEKQNEISDIARQEISQDLKLHPNFAQYYFDQAKRAGNSKEFSLKSVDFTANILTDKTALFLGSNLTYGLSSLGESFVDYLWQKDGLIGIKDVENNTFLTHQDSFQKGDSYIARFQKDLKFYDPEVLVIEISNKDLDENIALGDISDKHYDTQTIIGALEYLISQTELLWRCPIIVYLNYKNDAKKHAQLAEKVLQLEQKKRISVIDFSSDKTISSQPTRREFRDIWLPQFENELKEVLKNG